MPKQSLSIAVTAVALLGTTACQRDGMDTQRERDTAVDTQPRTEATGERISPEMQRRLDEAQERYTKLERQAADARRDLAARSGEVRSDIDTGLDRAINNAKTKLEAARKASADGAQRALDDLDEAITDLDKRLREYDKS